MLHGSNAASVLCRLLRADTVPDLLYQYVCCLELTLPWWSGEDILPVRCFYEARHWEICTRHPCWHSHSENVAILIPLGEGFRGETFVWRPTVSPRLMRICDLRLEMWYVSYTASTRVQHFVNLFSKNGNNFICVYSPKSEAHWSFTMWIIATISSRTIVYSTEASLHPGMGIAGRQFRSVDLLPDINFPWL